MFPMTCFWPAHTHQSQGILWRMAASAGSNLPHGSQRPRGHINLWVCLWFIFLLNCIAIVIILSSYHFSSCICFLPSHSSTQQVFIEYPLCHKGGGQDKYNPCPLSDRKDGLISTTTVLMIRHSWQFPFISRWVGEVVTQVFQNKML